jgi:hypothetical protein
MPILGGSPLNLINVLSGPTADGMSTFNGGKSRNINVNFYNAGREGNKDKLKKSGQKSSKSGAFSLFTGSTLVKPWPGIGTTGKADSDNTGLVDDYPGVSKNTLHNNDVYDTSILNIVEKLSSSKSAALRPSDFAYLKDIGNYPNNRLIICRRFPGPVGDDVYRLGVSPISVLIGFRPPGTDFLDITFGEVWEDAEASFESIVNSIGEDLFKVSGLGGQAAKLFDAIPLPGWTENLQRYVLEKIGVYSAGSSGRRLPAGDPNLIKEAKKRKTIANGEAGSGLTCKCEIKVDVEYEQKFISGLDPTIVYQDIIQNVLRFATSNKTDFGLDPQFGQKIKSWAKNPSLLIKDVVQAFKDALTSVVDEVQKFIQTVIDEAGADEKPKEENAAETLDIANQLMDFATKAFDKVLESLSKVIQKYEQRIKGVVSALSGLPSTPWHVTIGNPLRPIFSAGDMFTGDVSLTLGSTLMFNDLPANIKVSFSLSNARPWGLQEIMAKFNTGNIRSVNVRKDSNTLSPSELINDDLYSYSEEENQPITGTFSNVQQNGSTSPQTPTDTKPGSNPNAALGQEGSKTPESKLGNTKETINSDPNSSQPPAQKESQTQFTEWKSGELVESGIINYIDAVGEPFSGTGAPPTAFWRVEKSQSVGSYVPLYGVSTRETLNANTTTSVGAARLSAISSAKDILIDEF